MQLLVLIIALITLVVALAVLCIVALPLLKQEVVLPKMFTKTPIPEEIVEDDIVEETIPIEDFEPDFEKPIQIVYKDKNVEKAFTTGDGTNLTPLETDDVMEEDVKE